MSTLLMTWSPSPRGTQVLVTHQSSIIVKAQLSPRPAHPRAAQWLMEALALWEGLQVRAAVVAGDEGGSSVAAFWDAVGMDFGGPLYSLECLAAEPSPGSLLDDDTGGRFELDELGRAHVYAALQRGTR